MSHPSPLRLASSLFTRLFASHPTVAASAPGRVNLLGEHTDYNGGPVLPLALERRTVVVAGPAEGWECVSGVDGVADRVDPEAALNGSWTDYIAGVIRVLRRRGLAPPGARLAVASAVPVGAGLSSSSALTVATLKALTLLAHRRVTPAELVELAYEAEHDEVGVKGGRMDQTIACHARPGSALLFETATGELRPVPLQGKVWIVETGITRRLTDGALNTRRAECEQAVGLLVEQGRKVEALAELSVDELPAIGRMLPLPWLARVRHVVTETARTRAGADALAARDLPRLGRLLVEGHASLRDDYQSSCAEADYLVDSALRLGAYGARLTGAGWGGAVVLLAPEAQQARILAQLQDEFLTAYGRLPVVWSTRAGAGVRSESYILSKE